MVSLTITAIKNTLSILSEVRSQFAAYIIFAAIIGLTPALIAYYSKQAIDSIDSPYLFVSAAILVGILIAHELLSIGERYVRINLNHKLTDQEQLRGVAIVSKAKLEHFDNPEFFFELERVKDEYLFQPIEILHCLVRLIRQGVTLISVGYLLVTINWWLPIVLLLGVVPAGILAGKSSLERREFSRESAPIRVARNYSIRLLSERASAAEVKAFDRQESLLSNLKSSLRSLLTARMAVERRVLKREFLSALIGLTLLASVMGWAVVGVKAGALTLGSVVLLYQVFTRGQAVARSIVSELSGFYKSALILQDYRAFIENVDVRSDWGCEEALSISQIKLKQVSFKYPDAEESLLKRIDLECQRGEIVAIVGENGAGKSTLLKLLSGLYRVSAGDILIDGAPIQEFNQRALRDKISILFQDPIQYETSLIENITLGELLSEARLKSVIEVAQLESVVDRLPYGVNTVLGKEFSAVHNGSELSKGEWQRIALARALYRDSSLLILDEPTSALDYEQTGTLVERIKDISKDRITLIITHDYRVSAQADRVFLLEDGLLRDYSGARDSRTKGSVSSFREVAS